MRYVDIDKNGIALNVKLNIFRFKTVMPELTNIAYTNNLAGMNNLGQALTFVDELNLTGTGAGGSLNLDNTIKNINNQTVFYEGTSSKIHIFNHQLNTDIFKHDIWILETDGWQNSIAAMTIVDDNNVKVQLPIAKQCRIILQDIKDITKTYNII